MYIFKSPKFQWLRNQHHSSSVNRSINNLQIFLTLDNFRIDRNSMNLTQILVINIFSDNLNQFLIAFKLDISSRSNFVYFIDNSLIVWSKHLSTIVPICFIAIVFFWIMRSSQNNTALASQVTNSKWHFRSRTHIFEQIDFDTVSRKDISRNFSKQAC